MYLLRIAAQARLENTPRSFALTDLWERGGLEQTGVTDAKKGVCYRSYRKRNPRNGCQNGRNRTARPGGESRRQPCRNRAVKYDQGIAYVDLLLSSVQWLMERNREAMGIGRDCFSPGSITDTKA